MITTIHDFPPEILCEILEKLTLKELIEKQTVCKLWNELILSSVKVKRITVDSCTCLTCRSKWRNSSRPIDLLQEFCHPNLFALLLDRPILSNLKWCAAELGDEILKCFHPNDLNVFRELVHLEIDYWAENPIASVEWRLLKLETLRLVLNRGNKSFTLQLTIDCPKLRTLAGSFPKDNLLDIKSPETIRVLDFQFNRLEFSKFKSLEVYRLGSQKLKNVNDDLLRQLPRLKTLDLYGYIDGFDYQIDEIKPLLKQLLNCKHRTQPDSKLFVAGIHLQDERSVDELDLRMIEYEQVDGRSNSSIGYEHLYMKNYPVNLQDNLGFIKDVDYSCLMSLVSEVPDDYFRRFFNIWEVNAKGEIQDPGHFKWFLKKLEFLNSLNLIYPALDQAWYDDLPECCSLKTFELLERVELELNFDFLSRFSELKRLRLN